MAPGRRGSVRSGSERIIDQIVESARFLKDNPDLVVPSCKGSCPLFCYFKRARKGIDRRHGMIGDDDKLSRWSTWGNKLARSYASLLRIAEAGEEALEYFQDVHTHQGEVPIAPWGDAPSLAHVGMQHHQDHGLRLLKAVPFVGGDDIVYATKEGLVCAHDHAPPEETVDLLEEEMPVELAKPGRVACPHGDDPTTATIQLTWPDGVFEMDVCPSCSSGNLLAQLQQYMVTPKVLDVISVGVDLEPLRDPEGNEDLDPEITLPESVLSPYSSGEQNDEGLIREARRAREFEIKQRSEPLVVRQGVVYRPPYDELFETMDPPEPQRTLVEAALEVTSRPIALERGTSVELLADVWEDVGEEVLVEVLGEDGRELYDPFADAQEIERLLDQVREQRAELRVESELPSYEHVPEPVDLADEVVRALVGEGRDSAQQLLSSAPQGTRGAVGLALIEVLDLPQPSWTASHRRGEMAEHLVPYVEKLVDARGDEYHAALSDLLKATGSTQELDRAD